MIEFDGTQFLLHTEHTTYAMGLFQGLLLHLYWGRRLHRAPDASICTSFLSRPLSAKDLGDASSDNLPQEYATFGSADLRQPALDVRYQNGSTVTRLAYVDHTVTDGKPPLPGLPATYCEEGDGVQTLEIHLADETVGLDVYLSYTVFPTFDAIARSARIVNHGAAFELDAALSAMVDFHGLGECDLVHLDGAWARERAVTRNRIVPGTQGVESRYGASSAMHNPFLAICSANADERQGDVYGFSLVYSGCFTARVDLDPYNGARAAIGINPFHFRYLLESGESFTTPEAVLVYSADGFGGMSRCYHRLYRTRLCRGKYRDADRFVLLNNWEATYFSFNEDRIVEIAKKAAEIGVDTMVLDDGWFGKRNDGGSSLGDWVENREKLPGGLEALSDRIHALGLRFGLWFEPEMVNPVSNLYEAHPDWVLHVEGRPRSETRNQLILDLSRQEVCDYVIEAVSAVLRRVRIEYVKWDMNRYMSEVGSAKLPPERQGEVMHRYMLGLYHVFETLTTRFPHVLFEGCASGGGRFDPGILHYMPQIWTSDDTDAVERLDIQFGTSLVYPYSTMSAHVSATPNHQVGRTTPFQMRCDVALPGQFGFELDLNRCTDAELETARASIERYRALQCVFHEGDCYRLTGFRDDCAALAFVAPDGETAVVSLLTRKATPNAVDRYIRLDGLDERAVYRCEQDGVCYGGDFLMYRGLAYRCGKEHESRLLVFHRVADDAEKKGESRQ